jgi:deoxyribonuclease V
VKLNLQHEHPWQVSPQEAAAIQRRLRIYLCIEDQLPAAIGRVAGVDVGFEDEGRTTRAAVAVLGFPDLRPMDHAIARKPTTFPYVPGLLSFREIPALLAALEQLTTVPDLLLVDGQGYAHPRRMGIASHLGLLTGIPSIGVGKTRLCGRHDRVPDRRGAWTALRDGKETIGAALRTRERVSPVFVSPGHRISLETSIDYVMRCTGRYRLPETTRQAHRLASG